MCVIPVGGDFDRCSRWFNKATIETGHRCLLFKVIMNRPLVRDLKLPAQQMHSYPIFQVTPRGLCLYGFRAQPKQA